MWQIGFTKVFLKEETRTGLERMLGEAMLAQIVRI
jgi:polyhydroxyalkanoate synthesis regulator protein